MRKSSVWRHCAFISGTIGDEYALFDQINKYTIVYMFLLSFMARSSDKRGNVRKWPSNADEFFIKPGSMLEEEWSAPKGR